MHPSSRDGQKYCQKSKQSLVRSSNKALLAPLSNVCCPLYPVCASSQTTLKCCMERLSRLLSTDCIINFLVNQTLYQSKTLTHHEPDQSDRLSSVPDGIEVHDSEAAATDQATKGLFTKPATKVTVTKGPMDRQDKAAFSEAIIRTALYFKHCLNLHSFCLLQNMCDERLDNCCPKSRSLWMRSRRYPSDSRCIDEVLALL